MAHGRLVQADRASVAPDVHEIDVIERASTPVCTPLVPFTVIVDWVPSAAIVHHVGEVSDCGHGQPVGEEHREEVTILETLRGWPDPQGAPPRPARPRASASGHRRGLESVRVRIIAWHGSTPWMVQPYEFGLSGLGEFAVWRRPRCHGRGDDGDVVARSEFPEGEFPDGRRR